MWEGQNWTVDPLLKRTFVPPCEFTQQLMQKSLDHLLPSSSFNFHFNTPLPKSQHVIVPSSSAECVFDPSVDPQ